MWGWGRESRVSRVLACDQVVSGMRTGAWQEMHWVDIYPALCMSWTSNWFSFPRVRRSHTSPDLLVGTKYR